jgi:hypothetical protein
MSGMRRRVGAWIGIGTVLAAAAMLVVFWLVEGLEPAGWLAGVLSAFAALTAFAMRWLDRTRPSPGQEPTVSNTFTGGNVHGTVVMGRDFSGPVVLGPGSAVPPPSGGDAPGEEPGR